MATQIDRERLQALVREGAQLVEVPADEYEDEHLAGAINLPLKDCSSGHRGSSTGRVR